MNGAHGNYRWFARLNFPADDGLQVEDDFRGQNNWIFCFMRVSAMAAYAMNHDIDRIDIGHGVARDIADGASGQLRIVMQGEAEIGTRKAFEEAVRQHGASAAATLLGG